MEEKGFITRLGKYTPTTCKKLAVYQKKLSDHMSIFSVKKLQGEFSEGD